ncbi:protein POLR1D-like isoform X1 [Micropterus salmoides]|uniref:protein POLR1D-like isoform X1 n=2 Tax=Micropterus salmoides TaxID=27706 RepID=UPI0018EC3BEB|nr:protein POLR1D-like isoform X1 [Micropterus salmoides]XP_038583938.1 protein POLR1D-like isoform X1 [Micropterus salmoides]
MAEENDLEKRAVEELLRETDRARVRAETMGPAGWLKCPLRSPNKRFLLNTLRSTGLQGRTSEPRDGHSISRGYLRSDSPGRRRDRSRTPPGYHRSNGGHADHKHHHRESCNNKDKKQSSDKDGGYKDGRDRRHGRDGQNRDRLLHE